MQIKFLLFIVLPLFCGCVASRPQKPAVDAYDLDLSVMGDLGEPLGTREIIPGVKPDHGMMIVNPLLVLEVNGRPLKPDAIEIRDENQKLQIQDGILYRLEGYESGGFAGDPDWYNPDVQQPFQFRTFFVVTKVIEAKPK